MKTVYYLIVLTIGYTWGCGACAATELIIVDKGNQIFAAEDTLLMKQAQKRLDTNRLRLKVERIIQIIYFQDKRDAGCFAVEFETSFVSGIPTAGKSLRNQGSVRFWFDIHGKIYEQNRSVSYDTFDSKTIIIGQ